MHLLGCVIGLHTCHGVYLLDCVSLYVLVGLCVMVILRSWVVCHGVYVLVCVSWCVLVGLCVMVCTCWFVCHGVYLLVCVSWCVLVGFIYKKELSPKETSLRHYLLYIQGFIYVFVGAESSPPPPPKPSNFPPPPPPPKYLTV